MQWCQRHWDALRAEVARQGMAGLVPTDGAAAAQALSRSAEGEKSPDSFDPLMGAMFAVNDYIGGFLGGGPTGVLWVMTLEGCPVCKVDELHMPICADPQHDKPCTTSVDWCFVNAVEGMRLAWQELGRR